MENKKSPPISAGKGTRIEYIDALRGFTMLLVVMFHVFVFSYRGWDFRYNSSYGIFFSTFRMPLFFFISGFIYYKYERRWDMANGFDFIKKKALIQLVPTAVFSLAYIYCFGGMTVDRLYRHIVDFDKSGYWFTIELFIFFIAVTLLRILFQKIRLSLNQECAVFALVILALTSVYTIVPYNYWLESDVRTAIQMNYHRYFIYFLFGCIVKGKFSVVERMFDNKIFTMCLLSVFVIIGLLQIHDTFLPMQQYVLAFTGITVVFSFFRHYSNLFSQQTRMGKVLQYVGRRTLDIYLLHYFFLPYNLQELGQWFSTHINPSTEFFCTLLIASSVIVLCLVSSNVLRVSPLLGKYLFGAK